MADAALRRLRASNALRTQVVELIARHMTPLEPDPKLLRRRLSRYGEEATWQLLALQEADFAGKGTGQQTTIFRETEALLRQLLEEKSCLGIRDLAVHGRELLELGFPEGRMIGLCLNFLLEQVLAERLPNEKYTLLEAAKRFLQENIS